MHPKTAARRAALQTLVAVEAGRILGLGLETAPGETRGFGREILSGSLRWRAKLDWTLAPLLKQPLHKLDPPVRAALRLALYERLWLKTPLPALANEYAGLMREERLKSATGFVNAVVRRLPEEARASPSAKKLVPHLAVEYSHPEWLVERYLQRFGEEECRALLEANNGRAALCLRVNTLKADRETVLERMRAEGIGCSAGMISPDAIIVEGGADPTGWAVWREGLVMAQDEAAQLVARLAAPAAGDFVVDVASAPGGKTTHLAQFMRNEGRILACDLAPGRLKLVRENAERLGISIIDTKAVNGLELAQELKGDSPDLVLLDAPCSGTGTFRRRPDARWRRVPNDIAELAELQKALLGAVAPLVAPGGTLVYSTCSLEPEENEEQVLGWLADNPGWRVEPASGDTFGPAVTDAGFIATLPHRHGCDGMFGARLVRVE